MLRACKRSERGFGLIELTVLIVVVGVLLAVAMQSMTALIESSRRVKTEREIATLADAIVGDPDITAAGVRSDFGYFGDVGSFPPNLDALASNPGSYATWEGPYIPAGYSEDADGFKTDEWGNAYSYSGGTVISSSGGSGNISKQIANATSDYLYNDVNGTIRDANDSLPGMDFVDSVDIVITYPDGSGGTTTDTYAPATDGSFTLASLPSGQHLLLVIYKPNADTLHRYLTVLPRHKSSVNLKFAAAHFEADTTGGGGLSLVSGSETVYGGGSNCDRISFSIENLSGGDINITSLSLTWSSPVSYFDRLTVGGVRVYDNHSPRIASGDVITFSSITISNGSTAEIQAEWFDDRSSGGGGNKVNMGNAVVTVLLSDGSTFDATFGACP